MGGNPLRSYRIDGMKPPEMSRQKFDVFQQPNHIQHQFNVAFEKESALVLDGYKFPAFPENAACCISLSEQERLV